MDVRLQAKLLRVLQERVVDRVGGQSPIPVDIRVLATSNRNLQQAVQEGSFREDLLFRLNVVNLAVPSLRERPLDILHLAAHFAEKYATLNGIGVRALSEGAKRQIVSSAWPGNVRELENAMHRAVLLAQENEIEVEAIRLPDGSEMRPAQIDINEIAENDGANANHLVGRRVADVERDLIINTLDHCYGNRTHAANILGISIRTLRNKLKQYTNSGVAVPPPGDVRMQG